MLFLSIFLSFFFPFPFLSSATSSSLTISFLFLARYASNNKFSRLIYSISLYNSSWWNKTRSFLSSKIFWLRIDFLQVSTKVLQQWWVLILHQLFQDVYQVHSFISKIVLLFILFSFLFVLSEKFYFRKSHKIFPVSLLLKNLTIYKITIYNIKRKKQWN